MKKIVFASFLALTTVTLLGCKDNGSTPSSTNTPPVSSPSTTLTSDLSPSSQGKTVARVNGQEITQDELMGVIKSRLSRLENQVYEIKRGGIDQIIAQRLLEAEAKKKNITVQELLKKEVQDKVGDVSDQEIQEIYDKNKARIGNKTLEEVKPQIKAQLLAQKGNTYRENFMNKLMDEAKIEVYIKRPSVEVGVGNSPSKGPEKAPVTIIEFTDFQCPFCSRARPTINQILSTYKNDVRYVMRNFPLDFHAQAKKAATASLCANEQKKFWEYSDKLWENQKAIDVDSLKKYAVDLGLNATQFNQCLDSDKYLPQVIADSQEGGKVGVTGTPAFFVNGKVLTGAQPFEAFKKVIDEELREKKGK